MLSAHDVARELRHRLPEAGDLKVHKLVYYCQGWHVAWTGEPMFAEAVEAWANGPVVADLWHDEKRRRALPSAQHLDDTQLAVVDYVVRRYGDHTGEELIKKTHLERPWREVNESDAGVGAPSPEITLEALAEWFGSDDAYLAHRSEVARLRERADVYGLEGPAMPEDLREATLRFLNQRA